MEYDDVIASAFTPSPTGVEPQPTVEASPARQLRDALEPIAMHSVWSRGVNERLADFGHNFMTSYVCSRAALMGQPEPGVVASAFAVFKPPMIEAIYQDGRSLCSRDELLSARSESVTTSLGQVLADADPTAIDHAATTLQNAVQDAPGVGRPLFSGLQGQAWPANAFARLWRGCEQFREHRGDSHVAACVADGLDAIEMNVLTELWLGIPFGEYSGTRGWTGDDLSAAASRLGEKGWLDGTTLTDAGRAYRDGLEARTDRLQQPIIAALDGELAGLTDQLGTWSQLCIDAQAFPPNAFKRAAG